MHVINWPTATITRSKRNMDIKYGMCSSQELHGFALLCFALLCFACFALLRVALHCVALHCFALLRCAVLCFAVRCIAQHNTTQHSNALQCIAVFCVALHCFACSTVHCIAFHCIALPHCALTCFHVPYVAVLWFASLCFALLRFASQCITVLCCAVICFIVSCCVVLCRVVLCCVVLCCAWLCLLPCLALLCSGNWGLSGDLQLEGTARGAFHCPALGRVPLPDSSSKTLRNLVGSRAKLGKLRVMCCHLIEFDCLSNSRRETVRSARQKGRRETTSVHNSPSLYFSLLHTHLIQCDGDYLDFNLYNLKIESVSVKLHQI